MSMPSSDTPSRVEQQPDGERIGARDDEPRARPATDLGPGAEQDLQTLARLVPAGEDDRVLAVGRVGRARGSARRSGRSRRRRRATGRPRRGRARRRRSAGRRDPCRKPQQACRASSSRGRPRRGGSRRSASCATREARDADRRRHRLVEVEHVEPLALEHAPDPEERARAEDDVRQRAVRGDDHRPPDGDHVRRRVAVAADPGVERTRELARGVVPHHEPAPRDPAPRARRPGARRARRPRPRTTTRTARRCRSSRGEPMHAGRPRGRATRRRSSVTPGRDALPGCSRSPSSSSSKCARKRAPDAGEMRRPCLREPVAARAASAWRRAHGDRPGTARGRRGPSRSSRSTSRVSPLWLRRTDDGEVGSSAAGRPVRLAEVRASTS